MEFFKLNHEATLEDIEKFHFPNQKIGVIAHMENEEGKILLQQRGIKSRDENGLYEDIGGKLEQEDIDFKSAILREIKEEAGENVQFDLGNSIGLYHCQKSDINWIFVIYSAKYTSGEFQIMEPEKCMGYKFFEYDEAVSSSVVSESCKSLIRQIKQVIRIKVSLVF